MAFRVYNKDTGTWDVQASKLARAVRVIDTAGKFKTPSKDVEECLMELKDDIHEMSEKVDYVYENGGVGSGGGGGGGSVGPVLHVVGEDEYQVTTDQKITLEYSFTSNNRGDGSIKLSSGGKVEQRGVSQGYTYKWTIGPFPRGTHYATLDVQDRQGFWSGPHQIKIVSGSLELVDNFDHSKTYTPGEKIEIPYEIVTPLPRTVSIKRTIQGIGEEIIDQTTGKHIWNVTFPQRGAYRATIEAYTADQTSNVIKYLLIAGDSSSLIVTSPQEDEFMIYEGQPLVLEYINSKIGENMFNTTLEFLSTNEETKTMRSYNGYNSINLGYNYPKGTFKFRLTSTTLSGQHSASIEWTVNIVTLGFELHSHTTDGLIAYFDASGKNNSDSTKAVWENKISGSNISCNLYDFNYNSNGWISVPMKSDLPYFPENNENPTMNEQILRFSGQSYAVIPWAPLANGLQLGKGFTVEVVFRTTNTGNYKAKVLSCMNQNAPNQGFEINTFNASSRTRTGDETGVRFGDNVWTRISYVFDKDVNGAYMYTYLNGVMSGFTPIPLSSGTNDNLLYQGHIILGAADSLADTLMPLPSDPAYQLSDFGTCDIRNIRIYNKALSNKELLDNFIADIRNGNEQVHVKGINGIGADKSIPIMKLYPQDGDVEKIGEGVELTTVIDYVDPVTGTRMSYDKQDNCKISWQGTSSKDYPRKNFTIKLFKNGKKWYDTPVTWDDNAKTGWRPEHRYTLKVNYMDTSQANNIASAKFVHDWFNENNPYPQQLDPAHKGSRLSVDGFPIQVYINDQYIGLYTFNLDRYANHNLGMETVNQNPDTGDWVSKGQSKAVMYEVNVNNQDTYEQAWTGDQTRDAALWRDGARSHFKLRYSYRQSVLNTPDVTVTEVTGSGTQEFLGTIDKHTELYDFITWISRFDPDNEDSVKEFESEMDAHMSRYHWMDYFIIAYTLGMIDQLGKNMVMYTLGPEQDTAGNIKTIWYPAFYDSDSILGLNNTGVLNKHPGIEMVDYETPNLKIWRLLLAGIKTYSQMKERYVKMRLDRVLNGEKLPPILSVKNLMSYYGSRVIDKVGQVYYNDDVAVKYEIPGSSGYEYMARGSRREYTERWIRDRLMFLDSFFGAVDQEVETAQLRSNFRANAGEVALRIKTYSAQKVKIKWSDGTEDQVLTCGPEEYTVFPCPEMTNDRNNNIRFYGVNNIMEIDGLEKLNLSQLLIGRMTRLTSVKLPGSELLKEIDVKGCEYLQELDLSDCVQLGAETANEVNTFKTIDVSKCAWIRKINVSNTKLAGLYLPTTGGVLNELNIKNTRITDFTMRGQEYLKNVDLSSNAYMKTINISHCNGLNTISTDNSSVSSLYVSFCDNLKTLSAPNCTNLGDFRIEGCDQLTKLDITAARSTHANLITLDLQNCINLEELITKNTTVQRIQFPKINGVNYNKLKIWDASGSDIMAIKYGTDTTYPSNLNLNGLTLTTLRLNGCKRLTELEGLNLVSSNGAAGAFDNCSALTRISGVINITGGSVNNMFAQCGNLVTLPSNMNFAGANNSTSMFYECGKITMSVARDVLQKFTSALKNTDTMFYGCSGLSGALPTDMLSKLTGVTNANQMFWSCGNINGAFMREHIRHMTSLQTAYRMFNGCKFVGSTTAGHALTADTFSANTELTDLSEFFTNNDLQSLPESAILQPLTKLSKVGAMFSGNSNMSGDIASVTNLLANKSLVTNVGWLFAGCRSITGNIPATFFVTVPTGRSSNITTVASCFQGCSGLSGEIPHNLLTPMATRLTDTGWLFDGCSNITGELPETLLQANTSITRTEAMFRNTKISGEIPEFLFKGLTRLSEIGEMFAGCSNLSGRLFRYFRDCKNLTKINGLFKNCSGITGPIPAREYDDVYEVDADGNEILDKYGNRVIAGETLWGEPGLFDHTNTYSLAHEVFSGCTMLTSILPPKMMYGFSNVANLSGFFYECRRITGAVPREFLWGCRSVTNLNSFMQFTPSIEKTAEGYCFPPDLFKSNSRVLEANNFCYQWRDPQIAGLPPKNNGTLHEDLMKGLISVKNLGGFFCGNPIRGNIAAASFAPLSVLTDVSNTFNSTGVESMDRNLFVSNRAITNFGSTFWACGSLTGPSFNYKANVWTIANKTNCFHGASNLSNYAEIVADGWA